MKGFFAAVGGLIAVAAVIVGGYLLVVALSGPKGAGDTIIKDNSVDNRTQAQQQFHQMYNDILAMDKNLDPLAATVKAHPNDRIAQTNLDGATLGCNQAVANYNAATDKILSRNWLDEDKLPYKINDSNPATDCKPTIG